LSYFKSKLFKFISAKPEIIIMGAGCTVNATNKSFLSLQVTSPQKKTNIKLHDKTQISNKFDHSEMLIPQNNIESLDYSPRFEEAQLKKLKIGKHLTETLNSKQEFWKSLLHGVSIDETLYRLQDLFYKNAKLFASKIEKNGSPEGFRWESWYFLFGNFKPSLLEQNLSNALYETLLSKESSSEEDIKKDLFRTFPKHPYFTEIEEAKRNSDRNTLLSMSEHMGNIRLFRILKAIANQCPNVGYCQGMNFVLGFLLVVSGGKECQTFQLFMKLAEAPKFKILGFFENGFPLLKLYCFIFYKLLEKKYHKLAAHLKEIGLPDSLWLTKWILTMLIYSFPLEINLRAWDFIIGSQSLFSLIKICLELVKSFEKKILIMDSMEIADFFREIIENKEILIDKKSELFIDMEALIKKARKIKLNDRMIRLMTIQFIDSLEKDEEKQNSNLLFYKEFGKKNKKKKIKVKKNGKGQKKE